MTSLSAMLVRVSQGKGTQSESFELLSQDVHLRNTPHGCATEVFYVTRSALQCSYTVPGHRVSEETLSKTIGNTSKSMAKAGRAAQAPEGIG